MYIAPVVITPPAKKQPQPTLRPRSFVTKNTLCVQMFQSVAKIWTVRSRSNPVIFDTAISILWWCEDKNEGTCSKESECETKIASTNICKVSWTGPLVIEE